MSAEPLRDEFIGSRSEDAAPDNRVYVVPPWASRPADSAPRSRWDWAEAWSEFRDHRWVTALWFEFKALVAALMLVGLVWSGLPSLYQLKSRLGIDLIPGVHAPDVMPFLDR